MFDWWKIFVMIDRKNMFDRYFLRKMYDRCLVFKEIIYDWWLLSKVNVHIMALFRGKYLIDAYFSRKNVRLIIFKQNVWLMENICYDWSKKYVW